MRKILSRLPLQKHWNTRAFTYNHYVLYAAATVITFSALIFQIFLMPILGVSSYLLFFASVVVCAWIGGYKVGIYGTVLSIFLIYIFVTPPFFTIGFKDIGVIIPLGFFLMIGVLVSTLSQNMHGALKNLEIKNQELERSEERYRLVVETVKDYSIYTLDKEGYITTWNVGAEQLKGYSQSEIIGKHHSIFFSREEIDEGKPWTALAQAMDEGRYEDESWRQKKDASTFWGNMIITPIKDGYDQIYGYSVITRDLTERREVDRRKDEFVSIASHELKTPLTSVKVFTQVLLKNLAPIADKTHIKYLMKMDMQIDKLTKLINDLLDVSKMQSGKIEFKKEPVNLVELTQEVVENMQAISDSHTIVLQGSLLHPIAGDSDRLSQVLINFISNAIKYSPQADRIEVSLAQDSQQAIVAVKDFGYGIDQKMQEKIFERFFRIYHSDLETISGLGMGLYIASEIVKRHDGKIWLESQSGEGSTFYMSLPLATK